MHNKLCPHCNTTYETKYANEVYCSLVCRDKARVARKNQHWVDVGPKKPIRNVHRNAMRVTPDLEY